VRVLRSQTARETLKKPRQMLYFAMGAAHRREARSIGKLRRKLRIERGFVFALMLDDRLLHNLVRLGNQGQSFGSSRVIESVCDFPQAIQIRFDNAMLVLQSLS